MFEIADKIIISDQSGSQAVALAVCDLARDLKKICGCGIEYSNTAADIIVNQDLNIIGSEQYRIDISSNGIVIDGSDELGMIYGIYCFSREALGVEPLWFWKDSYPSLNGKIKLEDNVIVSTETTFRYRGWFINDEDLLTEWHKPSGKRFIDFPFYSEVIALDVADAIYEAALRSGANLVIPASFIDVMNPPEAELISKAAARGLYVTQHHIEPLGVSHFGFENYWKSRGMDVEFSYGSNPEQVQEVWKAFAAKWYELAGDKIIWQLGLRGKGDTAIWASDKSVDRETAGKFISRALKEQMDIAKAIDKRPVPSATTTLWSEMAQLMAEDQLELPEQLITIFCDVGKKQEMDDDFHLTPRKPSGRYGAYYHIAYWMCGAHLVGGAPPARIERVFREVIAKGDTEYAIINISNIREHCIGIEAAMGMMNSAQTWRLDHFMDVYSGNLKYDYEHFYSTYIRTPAGDFQDGNAVLIMKHFLLYLKGEEPDWDDFVNVMFGLSEERQRNTLIELLKLKADEMENIANGISDNVSSYHRFCLVYQPKLLAAIYRTVASALEITDQRASLNEVIEAVKRIPELYPQAEYGKWKNWYRGDKKACWQKTLNSLIEINNR